MVIKLFVKKTPKMITQKNESENSVLTNSIIHWNKKMVEKYRKSNTLNDIENKSVDHNFSYQEFTDEKEEMSLSKEHLSEISKKDEIEGSAFIDENPFN